ncbi:MAG: Flp pilus assembly protein CpaB [Pseudomonadota bacterium]
MRLIAIMVLAFGAALAGGAMFYASKYFETYEQRLANARPEGPKTVNVIVAKETLRYGMSIEPNKHLRWVAWPEDSLPQGAFTSANALLGADGDRSKKRFVLRQIEPGEPILENKITGFGGNQRMAMRLGEGKRAFAIKIDAVSGVAGFVNPGDRVDVLMTTGGRNNLESVVIMQNVLVIAVDRVTDDQRNAPTLGQTATVEVSPEDAQKLALAQNVGRLSLSLRGFAPDDQVADGVEEQDDLPNRVDFGDLVGQREQVIERRDPGTTVILRRGGEPSGTFTFRE